MESLDELLAQLKAEHEQKKTPEQNSSSPVPPTQPSQEQSSSVDDILAQMQSEQKGKKTTPSPTNSPQKSSSVDDILAQMQSEQKGKKTTPSPTNSPQNSSSVDDILTQMQSGFKAKPVSQSSTPQNRVSPPPRSNPATDKLLNELQSDYQEHKKDVAEEIQNIQQKQEQQRLQAKREQRRREALKSHAQEWLKNLDLHSEEGLWFEEFSYSYDSKLDAAMDYLEALREVRF